MAKARKVLKGKSAKLSSSKSSTPERVIRNPGPPKADAPDPPLAPWAIKAQIELTRMAIRGEQMRHERNVRRLQLQLEKIQRMCACEDRTFHPDPSGNNDSFFECNTCGRASRR